MKARNLILTMALAATSMSLAAETRLSQGHWNITNADDNSLTLSYDGKDIVKKAYAKVTYRIKDTQATGEINSLSVSPLSVTIEDIQDEIGTGKALTRVYGDGTAKMIQTINLYNEHPFAIAQVAVTADAAGTVIESNHMVALASETVSDNLCNNTMSALEVPFDNDGHGRYQVYNFNTETTSHEVTCVFDKTSTSKFGMVMGSVDHDKWKSGITVVGTSNKAFKKLELLSGYTSVASRDYDWNSNTLIPHGYVKGEKVESARYLIGCFDDYRVGLETFAETCALVCPPAPWDLGNPMGWSTWGVMMNHVNTPAVKETAKWIKDNLFDLGFHDKQGQTVVSLDSFCDGWGMTSTEISQLGNKFLGEGSYREGRETLQGLNQRLGLYGGMVVWDWTFDSKVDGTGIRDIPSYNWGDCLLRYNGNPHYLFNGGQYCAIDPTHPAFYYNMDYTLSRWAAYNIKYLKFDFINSGICEGDSWYNPEITTGVMAYNYGMQIIYELAQKYDMYIVESMAPLFPYKWAHGRRSCCDRFSELGESEYVMNAMSWAWWTDRLYAVNDPDQLVLHKDGYNKRETEGENRVRVTSGMCTGAFIIGDSFSDKCVYTDDNGHTKGSVVAYPEESKARALKMFGNADINAYVRENTGSFRPVDNANYTSSQQTVYNYMRDTPDYVYVACFSFSKLIGRNGTLTFEELGIAPSNVKEIKELWTGETVAKDADSFKYNVPAGDVRVYRISKVTSGVDDITVDKAEAATLTAVISGNECVVSASADIASVELYDLSGRCLSRADNVNHVQAVMNVNVQSGVYIVNAVMADGTRLSHKTIAR
ncbi:MAG: T9SS type A sorting domain-containing protein [Bacteroidales bacterium]|nr:T9SS type A sorting domain-containing protein [Bacteroidales bacterium]